MMDGSSNKHYTMIVQGHMDSRWQDWYPGMTFMFLPDGLTRISGIVADQSALFGMLSRIRDLRLPLLLVVRGDDEVDGSVMIESWRKDHEGQQ